MINKVLNRISLFLIGILATSIVFAVLIKLINNTFGIALSFIVCIVIIYFGVKKTRKGQNKRIITYGMITSLITISVAAIILWKILANSLAQVL